MTKKAIVAGGGIAGLATARGLLGLGWDVTIYEQAPSFQPVGAGITLAPNAVRALDWLGFGQELRSKSMAHGEAAIRDASRRWLLRARVDELSKRFGVPSFALHRAELHKIARARAAQPARMRGGHRVTGVEAIATPTVTLEGPDGPGEDPADPVVGADGIHSGIRDLGITESRGRGERFGIVSLGNGQVYWFATASLPAGSHARDDLDELRTRYRRWHDPIPALLRATAPRTLLRHDIYHLEPPLPRYHAGRVVLLGDAAHALTPDIGQGGCQALEDAVTLVHALAGEAEVPAALAGYDRARRRRTQKTARTSALWGTIAQWRNPSPLRCATPSRRWSRPGCSCAPARRR